jgi:hypothetical protein
MKKRYHVLIIVLIISILIIANIGGTRGKLYVLFRNIPKVKILHNTKDYERLYTDHFAIRYKTKDKEILNIVAKGAEKYYDEICREFEYYPKNKTVIILYDNSEELLKNVNIGEGKPPMGVYYASTIQILSPKLWVPQKGDMEYLFMNEGPMVHEFTHLIIDDIAKGNYPLWFTEGMALYQEYVHTNYEWGKDVKMEQIYTVEELSSSFSALNQYLAYTQSFRTVKHMVDKYGFESIKKF